MNKKKKFYLRLTDSVNLVLLIQRKIGHAKRADTILVSSENTARR